MIPNHLIEYVEQSIQEIGINPLNTRGKRLGQWTFKYKDSTIWIDIFSHSSNPEKYYFQVMSPLCPMVNTNIQEFATDLLEINYSLYGCWICKKDNHIYILNLREALNLQKSEIDATIDRIATYRNNYWEKISFKYKSCWGNNAQQS